MTIEADILTTLNNFVGLSSLVSTRNYAVNLPQKPTYPNTVYMRVSTEPSNTLGARNALTNIRIQIDTRSNTLLNAITTASQVKKAIESATLFVGLYLNEETMPHENPTETYRVSQDFSIWFNDL